MKILYICTHNRCRSILSEAITNHWAQGILQAFSAGSQPVGAVHPLSLQYLAEKGIATAGLKSQSWQEFEAIQPDLVITVCDSAANEMCPLWFGNSLQLHWPLPDPSKLTGNEEDIRNGFLAVMETIEQRVKQLLALELHTKTPQQRLALLNALTGA